MPEVTAADVSTFPSSTSAPPHPRRTGVAPLPLGDVRPVGRGPPAGQESGVGENLGAVGTGDHGPVPSSVLPEPFGHGPVLRGADARHPRDHDHVRVLTAEPPVELREESWGRMSRPPLKVTATHSGAAA